MIKLDEKTWESAKAPREAMKPRICMPTSRGIKKKALYYGQYEAQYVLLNGRRPNSIEPGRGYAFIIARHENAR